MASILRYLSTWSSRLLQRVPLTRKSFKRSIALSLPDEIWTLIIMELELNDIFSSRLVCRYLHDICAARLIWRHIFLKNLGSELPKQFFLRKPLKENSAYDIESALRAWKRGWTPKVPLEHYNRKVNRDTLIGQRLYPDTMILTPGGRWAIAASNAGAIWWFDLSDDWTSTATLEPEILIPSTVCAPEAAEETVQVQFSIDFFSDESLGSSGTDHHLSQFNIAVITRVSGQTSSYPAHVGVWRVHECEDRLKLGDRLSAYTEIGSVEIADISLYGPDVAYGFDTGLNSGINCVVIVDWATANEDTREGEIMRRYIPFCPASKLILLPDDRIIVVNEGSWADIVDWRKECELSNLPPSEQENVDTGVKPIWSYDERERGPIKFEAMAHPLIFSDAIRLVLPAVRRIYGVAIPINDRTGDAIQIQTLFKGGWKMHQAWQIFAYRQAVGSRNARLTFFSAQYRWRDGISSHDTSGGLVRFTEVGIPDGMLNSSRFVTRYDQYSQRVVLVQKDGSQFVTLNSPSS